MNDQKHPSGWYESENGVVFHALTDGGMSQETLELLGKMAEAAAKMMPCPVCRMEGSVGEDVCETCDGKGWVKREGKE